AAGAGGKQAAHQGSHTNVTPINTGNGGSKSLLSRGARIAEANESLINSILKEVPALTRGEMDRRESFIQKNSGRPATAKGIRKARESLTNTGYKYDQLVVVK